VLCPKIEFIFQFKKSKALKNKSISSFFFILKGGFYGGVSFKPKGLKNRAGGLINYIALKF